MKLVKYVLILQLSHSLCQAFQNGSAPTDLPGVQVSQGRSDVTGATREPLGSDPLVHNLGGKCNWTLRMPGHRGVSVWLRADSAHVLIEQICQERECGAVYRASTSSSSNATCFHGCTYLNGRLQSCSRSEGAQCTAIGGVACGHSVVRLAGGQDRCAGRVELWKDGHWGTVCDDQWSLGDADVVCAQLGCGYALSVTGQGGSFPPGRGSIYLDELNCTGREENLWACPAARNESDCGHKEDAGVVCSEMRAIRLTGGLDRCAGVLEVHRNGSWGTVCDNCWNKNMATMVCSMLRCGSAPRAYTRFSPSLKHNDGPLYYYHCTSAEQSLWECSEYTNTPHLCQTSKASGVVCNGSLGFPVVSTENVTEVTTWTTGSSAAPPPTELFAPSPELLSTVALAVLLVVFLTTNTVLCCLYRRRHAVLFQQKHSSPRQPPSECHQNAYEGTVDLVKVTAGPAHADGPPNPRSLWNQLSSADSASVDTDYEQYDPSADPPAPLSTFHNSQRHRTDVNPLTKPSGLDSLLEEGYEPTPEASGAFTAYDPQYTRVSKISVDSFDSSSTSSGECYENVNNGYVAVAADPRAGEPAVENAAHGPSWHGDSSRHRLYTGHATNLEASSDEESGHIYSPVSPD